MLELTAVNTMLRFAGRQGVNQIVDGDQTSNVALETLARVRREILEKPYLFNEIRMCLQAEQDGRVALNLEYLQVIFLETTFGERLDPNDGIAYVWDVDRNDWVRNRQVDVIFTFDIENFRSIPESFASWIAAEAASEFFLEVNQFESTALIRKAVRRRSIAMNALPRRLNHSTATGFHALAAFNQATVFPGTGLKSSTLGGS